MRVRRIVSICAAVVLVIAISAQPAAAATSKPFCAEMKGRTIGESETWRLFQRSVKGRRSYRGSVRVDTYACRFGSRTAAKVARWTNTGDTRSRIAGVRFTGDYAGIAARYDSGISAGTFVMLLNLPARTRTRIEGPLASEINEFHVSPGGAIVMVTTAGPMRSLDAYDGAGRRTLATGDFVNVAVGDGIVYWTQSDGIHSAPLTGSAVNEFDAFARMGPG